jgi:hypothetical protein
LKSSVVPVLPAWPEQPVLAAVPVPPVTLSWRIWLTS